MRPSPIIPFHTSLLSLALLFLVTTHDVSAKISSGMAHLSGAKTEATLVKFAVSASSSAKIDLNLTSYGMYEDEKELRFRIYIDDEWRQVKRTPLCSDKVKLSQRAVPIVFDYVGYKADDRRGKKPSDKVEIYTARIQHEIKNPPNLHRNQKADRPRYFYFVIDDCSLEKSYHDNKIPDMTFNVQVLNGRPSTSPFHKGMKVYEHLPADEDGMGMLLVLSVLISGSLAMMLFYKLARTIGGEVHVAILVVMAACVSNGMSGVCELIHLEAYSYNGVGTYAMDAFSSYFEALSDAMVALILLSIGGGWTLPSDVLGGGLGDGASNGAGPNKFMKGVRNPAGSLLALGSGDKVGGIVAITIILVHIGLAQWGRTFDDDFDTYHALEHPPGRALMILRFILGLIFVTGVGIVRSGGRCPPSLMTFLTKFALVGLSYFASLPGISMFVGSVLPYHKRHQALHWGAAMVQACCLCSLTWLFIGKSDASAYHKLSRVGKKDGDGGDLTESIAANAGSGRGPSLWWCVGKTKIRLD